MSRRDKVTIWILGFALGVDIAMYLWYSFTRPKMDREIQDAIWQNTTGAKSTG